MQYELEMACQDLAYKKQQKEELVSGVMHIRNATHSPLHRVEILSRHE